MQPSGDACNGSSRLECPTRTLVFQPATLYRSCPQEANVRDKHGTTPCCTDRYMQQEAQRQLDGVTFSCAQTLAQFESSCSLRAQPYASLIRRAYAVPASIKVPWPGCRWRCVPHDDFPHFTRFRTRLIRNLTAGQAASSSTLRIASRSRPWFQLRHVEDLERIQTGGPCRYPSGDRWTTPACLAMLFPLCAVSCPCAVLRAAEVRYAADAGGRPGSLSGAGRCGYSGLNAETICRPH